MKIERIKIENPDKDFEVKFDKKESIVCVLDNETYYHGSIYENNFLYNILKLLKIDKRERIACHLTECDVNVLVNDKYTIRVERSKQEESFENGKKGYISMLKRSYFADEKTYDKNKRRHGFRYETYLEDILGYELKEEAVVFDNYFYKRFEEYLYEYLVCINCYTKEVVEDISDYVKEISPLTLANGDKAYINIPKEVDEEWSFKLLDNNGKEYNSDNDEAYVNLVEFITANNIVKDICRKRNGEDYPIYICDAFNKLSEEQTKTVLNLIKDMNKQVFIILREPNELVSSYADKTIEYYFNPDNKIEEELPF